MKTAAIILRDQLSDEFSFIKDADTCVFIESLQWAQKLPQHKKKIVLHFSSMRHFSDELVKKGKKVIYYPMCEDAGQAFKDLKHKDNIDQLIVMEPSEWGVKSKLQSYAKEHGLKIEFIPNEQFIYQDEVFDFTKPPMLETFYRHMRKTTKILMHGDKPLGGLWNFDKENRKKAPDDIEIPQYPKFKPDEITLKVMDEVKHKFKDNFGDLDDFHLACTRKDALKMLNHFIDHKLRLFGPYQDAMMTNEHVLFHSLLSPLLNINLLRPQEVIEAAEKAYHDKKATLESTEGFIRQILGWREYVYQVYKANMPSYKKLNYFHYKQSLPSFYWDGQTKMHCISEAVAPVIHEGINHHIQRLMVTGNFALIAGINPQEVNDWYHFGYIDALDWVVTPNVLGLSLYADGGMIATKPYAASAAYIQKMSNYCKSCPYNPKTVIEEDSCPFNALYWDFIDRNKDKFKKNHRMSLMVEIWNKKDKNDKISIINKAAELKKKLNSKGDL